MKVSFSGNAKAEICRDLPSRRCCAQAMAFGILLYCNTFTDECVRIVTESREFAFFLPRLFRRAFNIDFDEFPSMAAPGKLVFQITDRDKLAYLLNVFGFDPEATLALHVNLSVLEEDHCRQAFLMGAFLSGGSVTDPEKGYHLEMATGHRAVCRETCALFQEVMGFYPKLSERGANGVLYLKQSEQIQDFLAKIGAASASMGITEAKIEKELMNQVIRRCNCDEANTSKVVDAAQAHLAAIRILRERGAVDSLPEKLKQAVTAREENPEASLTELAAMMNPPITKPAMNHRLKKLVELSREANQ